MFNDWRTASRLALVLIALALIVGGATGVLGTDKPGATPARETKTGVVAASVGCEPGAGRVVKCRPFGTP
jgi:hypothetical protein